MVNYFCLTVAKAQNLSLSDLSPIRHQWDGMDNAFSEQESTEDQLDKSTDNILWRSLLKVI